MKRFLVLGAGQLGHMLAAAGARLGLTVDRYDLASNEVIAGTSNHRWLPEVDGLYKQYDIITAELEHFPISPAVTKLCSAPNWVNGRALDILSHREQEKAFLDRLQVPTAAWCKIDSVSDLQQMQREHGNLVVKTIRHGYDGRGQWRVGEKESLPQDLETEYGSLIAEKRIDFKRELSLVGARWADGTTLFYPLVETYHQDGILRFCLAPGIVANALQHSAEQSLGKIMNELDYVGVMAMECFEIGDGYLVNELAPRVHNSGHWTQLGTMLSQFDLHLRTLAGLPAHLARGAEGSTLMLNLIGIKFNPAWLAIEGLQCHWYAKEPRPGRKLGHINLPLGTSDDEVRIAALLADLDADHAKVLRRAMDLYRQRTEFKENG